MSKLNKYSVLKPILENRIKAFVVDYPEGRAFSDQQAEAHFRNIESLIDIAAVAGQDVEKIDVNTLQKMKELAPILLKTRKGEALQGQLTPIKASSLQDVSGDQSRCWLRSSWGAAVHALSKDEFIKRVGRVAQSINNKSGDLNLNADEIYDQVVLLDRQAKENYSIPLTNIVYMGMGEPLMNYNNVIKAIDMITSPEGLGMSPKRIMVSTSGVPKMIKKLADDGVKFKLAVSLHSAIDEIRSRIMPFSENFPLADLRESLEYWYRKTKSKISYEYVVWKGINDDKASVDALVKFCKYVPCKVNLIEYNPIDDGEFQQASEEAIAAYIKGLEAIGIVVKVRRSRGKDIDAACGQLANKS